MMFLCISLKLCLLHYIYIFVLGNSLIDAAKRMALLMAEMSRLVQEGGNKGEVSTILSLLRHDDVI